MPPKTKPAARAAAGSMTSCPSRAPDRLIDATKPPTAQGELAWSPHSATVGIRIVESRDKTRISIEIWTLAGGRWRLAGVSPSFAAVLLDDVIAALHQARDVRAGRT